MSENKYYNITAALIKNLPLTLKGAMLCQWRKGQSFSSEDATLFLLELPLNGKFVILTEQGKKILQHGDIFIGHQNRKKYIEAVSGQAKKISLSLGGKDLQQILNSCSLLTVEKISLQNVRYIERLFFKAIDIIEQIGKTRDPYQLNASSIAYRILVGISSHLQLEKYPQRLKTAVLYCENNISGDLSLETLANECNSTAATLIRLFKKHLNTTPIKYLNQVRMNCATRLLKSSNLQIKEIAFRCGYNDPYHFSKEFKKYFKLPPRDYRKF